MGEESPGPLCERVRVLVLEGHGEDIGGGSGHRRRGDGGAVVLVVRSVRRDAQPDEDESRCNGVCQDHEQAAARWIDVCIDR